MLPVPQQLALAHQQIGAPQHESELRDLAGLQRIRPELDPPLGAVERLTELRHQHDQQQQQRNDHHGVGQQPEHPYRQAAAQHQQGQADAHPGRLAGEHRIRGAQLLEGTHAGGGKHHDQTKQQQQSGGEQQKVVGRKRPGQHGYPGVIAAASTRSGNTGLRQARCDQTGHAAHPDTTPQHVLSLSLSLNPWTTRTDAAR